MGVAKKPFDMGNAPADAKSLEAWRWCIRNKIHIYPIHVNAKTWKLEIENNGKKSTDPTPYGKTEIWNKLYEYCRYYFNKYNKE